MLDSIYNHKKYPVPESVLKKHINIIANAGINHFHKKTVNVTTQTQNIQYKKVKLVYKAALKYHAKLILLYAHKNMFERLLNEVNYAIETIEAKYRREAERAETTDSSQTEV